MRLRRESWTTRGDSYLARNGASDSVQRWSSSSIAVAEASIGSVDLNRFSSSRCWAIRAPDQPRRGSGFSPRLMAPCP
jgi:hypothetical protein